ncbi:unnamed protein product [Pocillopora meandrina]|uniref:Uncharacterized protein n=1 Tax=Pocillopora meandrina TaxID=46732 RepID=A0AAU9XPF5_9CNID|nr:unnamed protein product [Pocillopora meandrina]
MICFSVLFAFVFLVGNDAALPNVGSCTFMEHYCSARKCSTAFIKIFQKDPKANCGAELSKLKNCVVDVMMVCMGDSLQESQVRDIVDMTFTEKQQCLDGSMEIPTMPPTSGSICSASFSSNADTCVRSFHQKFAKDKSDPALCSENAKAKRCLKNLIDFDCNFPALAKEALELAYSDYNPFCANNRDPGATGNDQCDGVQDKSGDALKYFNAAAGIKSGVLQTLMFASFFLLLFFKV